jgi:hypothetical protein
VHNVILLPQLFLSHVSQVHVNLTFVVLLVLPLLLYFAWSVWYFPLALAICRSSCVVAPFMPLLPCCNSHVVLLVLHFSRLFSCATPLTPLFPHYTSHIILLMLQLSCCSSCIITPMLLFSHYSSHVAPCALPFSRCSAQHYSSPIAIPFTFFLGKCQPNVCCSSCASIATLFCLVSVVLPPPAVAICSLELRHQLEHQR